jgi:K+-sensing histidine kinase KdpD
VRRAATWASPLMETEVNASHSTSADRLSTCAAYLAPAQRCDGDQPRGRRPQEAGPTTSSPSTAGSPSTSDSLCAGEHQSGRDISRSHLVPRRPSEQSAWAPDPFDWRDCFAGYVAHELRTPIALQLALAESALADPRADEVAWREMAEAVVASCEQQHRLIEALLDFTRSQRGPKCQEPVDIAAITGHVLRAHELGELKCAVVLEPAITMGDPALLERLVANLVSNAIRHNIHHGRIEVTTRANERHALLAVANTGPLISDREIPRLFHPFECSARPNACADGIGLGLAIVKSIADAHDATVATRASARGGLEIEVRFPATLAGEGPGTGSVSACRPPDP